ncbi:MAG: hydrogenase iron-sulfur subunit [Pseudomonadota bacterium]
MAASFQLFMENIGELPEALRSVGHEVAFLAADDRLRIIPTGVWESVCSDCIICESSCPVLKFDHENKHMTVHQVACKGCGVCVPACPTGALQQRNLRYGAALAETAEALGKELQPPNSCNSCGATGGENIAPEGPAVKVVCASRLDAAMVLDSLAGGYAGVLVVGCLREEMSHANNAPILARHEVETRELMDLLGIDSGRLSVIFEAPGSEAHKLLDATSAFLSSLEACHDRPA